MSKKANDDALLKSAARGDKSGVSKALKAGVDANVTDERLRSPLIVAAEGGHEKVVRLLLDRGANVRHTDRNGATALHYVMRSNKLEALDAIVEALEKVSKLELARKGTSSSIRRATAAVFKSKSRTSLETPLDSGPSATFRKWMNLKDDHGQTPLHVAVTAKAEEQIVRRMLLRGADPNIPNKQGKTVLDLCDSDRSEYITGIVQEKEDVEARAIKELIEAVQNGKTEDLSMYLRNISRPSRLHLINGQNEYGQTALYVAAGTGQLRVLQMLVDAGANANVADFTNRTALHQCAVEGQKATALILCSQGAANVNARDMHGRTPLHGAAEWGRKEMAAFLLTRRKVIKVPTDNLGQTPLHRAAITGRRNTTKLLLKRYSYDEANTADLHGNTALHLAAQWHKSWICEVLAEGKMTLDTQNKDGNTALHMAVLHNRPENVKALIQRGADPSTENKAGDNAVHAACRSKNAVVLVEALLATARLSADEIAEQHAERKKKKAELREKLDAATPRGGSDDEDDENVPENGKKKRPLRNISWAAADHYEGQGQLQSGSKKDDNEIRLLSLEDQKLSAVNANDASKKSPIEIAVAADNKELAASLAFFGSKLDAVASAGSDLKQAVSAASDERENATPVSRLKEGIRAGDLHLVRRCLASGVSINHVYTAEEKRTPLHFACASNKPEIVTYLVMHGANPDLKDSKLRTPQEMGGYGLESLIEDAVLEYETKVKDDKRRALFSAIEKAGSAAVEVVKKMSQDTFDLNSQDEFGYTALHMCALAENEHALSALLKCGVDLEVEDEAGRTPLQLAADRHHRGVAQLLADKGAQLRGVELDKIPDADAEAEELADRDAQQALSEKLSASDPDKKARGDAKRKSSLFKRTTSDASMMSELTRRIPLRAEVIKKICLHLQRKHLDEQGLFRLSGLKEDVLLLHNTFDCDPDDIELDGVDVHVITGALKHYLREQSMPLVPFHLYDSFLEAFESSEAEQMPMLLNCLDRLPPENKPVFQCLWQLLAKTIEHVDKNKMTAKNLGIIFGPTLMRPEKQSALEGLHKSQLVGEIFALLIENHRLVTERLPTGANYRIFKAPPPLTDQDWNVLLTSARQREYGKDEFVLKQGSKNFSLFRMKRGSVRVEVNGNQVAKLEPGEIFGELSFLGNYFTSADVISCGADTVIYEIEMKVARAIFAAEPHVFYKFYYNLAYTLADRLTNREAKAKHAKASARSGVQKSAEQIDAETEVLTILDNKGLTKSLRDFLKVNKQHGNLLGFWRQLQELKVSTGAALQACARTLFDTYMKDPASFPPLANQRTLCQAIESDLMQSAVTKETYMPVEDALLSYLATSVLPAFKESDQYKNQIAMIKLGVYTKDGSYTQYDVHKVKGSAATIIGCLAAGLNPSMSKKERDSYQLYAVVDDKATVMPATSSILELLESSSGGKLLYTDVNPEKKEKKKKKSAKVEDDAVVIKEYPCKHQRSGKLFIKQHESLFQAKVLGLEKKVLLAYTEVGAIDADGKTLKVKLAGKSKPFEFKFNSNEMCDEAYGIIQAIWQNYAETNVSSEDKSVSSSCDTTTDMSDLSVSRDDSLSLADSIPEDDVQERHWEIILMGASFVVFFVGASSVPAPLITVSSVATSSC
eukprot:TRINITY_DN3380_c0_g1_i2.p1 TRINITY_DN3380_c0_g1~~TRINITY_DN3380_c0_g1_i2.p1  ORF type:complete len:1629 (-),score=673.34 TRINITY_DN3380_c0_g1_i2:147-5033(-)